MTADPERQLLALVADIGGTSARFALTDLRDDAPRLSRQRTLPCAEFASLRHAVLHYLEGAGSRPARAAIAVASPGGVEEIRLTNRAWSFSRRELQASLGLDALDVLNDFGAIAWAVPALDVLNDFGAIAWAVPALGAGDCEALHGAPDAPLANPVTVLGPGTGFGVSLLTGDAANGWHVVETEGGHVGFAPLDDEERAIAAWLQARFGRVSNERLLSGAGLSHIEAALAGHEAPRDPATIVEDALTGRDPVARRALDRFCAVLGSIAGDVALVHGARTVMIAGGIVPRFIPFLRASAFRERFLAKGRMAAYLEPVLIRIITHAAPGLLGAATYLRTRARPQRA